MSFGKLVNKVSNCHGAWYFIDILKNNEADMIQVYGCAVIQDACVALFHGPGESGRSITLALLLSLMRCCCPITYLKPYPIWATCAAAMVEGFALDGFNDEPQNITARDGL